MKEFDINVSTGYSLEKIKKTFKPDVITPLTIGGNVTFMVDKDFDIPSGEDFNIVTEVKPYGWRDQRTPEILKMRLHNCRVCSIAYREDYNSVQVNYKSIELFGPINYRDRKLNKILK